MHHFIHMFHCQRLASSPLEQHILMDGDHGTYFLRLGLRNLLNQDWGAKFVIASYQLKQILKDEWKVMYK